MAIDYTQVNPGEVAADVMSDRAKEAEERAYIAEVEALRQEAILAVTEPGEKHAERESDLRNQRLEAEKQRRKADRANGAAPLTDTERHDIHAAFLARWIKGIETQHAAQTAIRNEQGRLIELNGKSGLSDDEKLEAEQERATAVGALYELELVHGFVVELQDELKASAPKPAEDHPAHGHGHLEAVPD